MRIQTLGVEGLRHGGTVRHDDLEPVSSLPAGPPGIAVCDGLLLFAAALDHTRVPEVLSRLGLGVASEISEDGPLTDEISGLDPHGVEALVDQMPVRRVLVHASLTLDPPLYRTIRDQAARDPKILAALSTEAEVHVRVGWLFNRAGTHASPAALSVKVGEVPFSMDLKERPPWVPELLQAISTRVDVLDPLLPLPTLAAEFAAAQHAHDPRRRARFTLATELLSSPPFGLPELAVVRRGEREDLCFGPGLVPARLLGSAAQRAIRWVHATVLRNTDVLAADLEGDHTWLTARIDGEQATLEQVLLVGCP